MHSPAFIIHRHLLYLYFIDKLHGHMPVTMPVHFTVIKYKWAGKKAVSSIVFYLYVIHSSAFIILVFNDDRLCDWHMTM
jgi:hypothetical protein